MREERKVVTALFADLVGSTGLSQSLEPEEVKLVVGEAVGRIVREVESLGGYVKDLAGDGVLAFFGAPVASEDDAERAARVGLQLAEELAAYGREVEQSWGIGGFGVRVGISTGPVVLGALGTGGRVEYAAFGETVNRAARLQGAAEPGSVLVDEATWRDLEGLVESGEPVELELKGLATPVRAHPLLSVRTAPQRRGSPLGIEAELVGRERELEQATAWLDRVRSGTGGVLVFAGEAGIGKTRLLAELHARFVQTPVEGAEPIWLEGRCVSYGESLPLWPFRDLLRGWLGVSDEPELRVRVLLRRRVEALFGDRAAEVYPYLGSILGLTLEPDAAGRLSQLSPEALQFRTFEVVGTLLERLAEAGPVVVVLEDLHWADPTSVQLVERLLPLTEQAALLLVIVHRAERDHASWALRELTAREYPHLLRELALEPLSGDAERELLLSLTGGDTLPRPLADQLLSQAEGNPFFLEELVRSLADAGALVQSDGAWRFDHEVPVEIPQTVERVVVARIDRLDADCHAVITAAAALGRRFGLALLDGVTGDGQDVEAALHELQRLDLIRTERRWPQPEYRFKHALIQEAAYRLLVGDARTALHRQAAEWLERAHADNLDEVVGLLAHHWLAAKDEDKAIAYLTRAADRARGEYALSEAIDLYRELLPLLEQRGERQAVALVLFKLGLALHTALRFGEANTIFGQAFERWQPLEPCSQATATIHVARELIGGEHDPPRSYAPVDMQVQMALFDRLVERWPEATIVPSLAERWEISDDGLRYVFHLREGLTWSDGTPLTAHDVEFGVKRSLDPERPGVSVTIFFVLEGAQDYALGRSGDSSGIGVRALDDRTVEFRLLAPAPYFLSVVNRPDGGPQPRHAIEAHGDDWLMPERQVVSGAFSLAERSSSRIVLERRTASLPRPGNVARVEIEQRPLEECLRAFDRGESDVVVIPPGSPDSELQLLHQREADLGPPAWTIYLTFVHDHPVLGQVDVRRALAHAVDRERLHAGDPPSLLPGTGGLVPPALQGHTPDIAPRFDPERARALLADADVGRLLAVTTRGGDMERLMRTLVSCWRDVLGLDVELEVLETVDFARERMRLVEYGAIAPSAWFPGYPDPEYFLRLLLHTEAADNRGGWSHQPFDDLIEQARREPDGRRRLALFHEADRVAIADQVAVIPLAYARNVFFVQPSVRGWWEFGKSWSSFAELEVGEDSPRV